MATSASRVNYGNLSNISLGSINVAFGKTKATDNTRMYGTYGSTDVWDGSPSDTTKKPLALSDFEDLYCPGKEEATVEPNEFFSAALWVENGTAFCSGDNSFALFGVMEDELYLWAEYYGTYYTTGYTSPQESPPGITFYDYANRLFENPHYGKNRYIDGYRSTSDGLVVAATRANNWTGTSGTEGPYAESGGFEWYEYDSFSRTWSVGGYTLSPLCQRPYYNIVLHPNRKFCVVGGHRDDTGAMTFGRSSTTTDFSPFFTGKYVSGSSGARRTNPSGFYGINNDLLVLADYDTDLIACHYFNTGTGYTTDAAEWEKTTYNISSVGSFLGKGEWKNIPVYVGDSNTLYLLNAEDNGNVLQTFSSGTFSGIVIGCDVYDNSMLVTSHLESSNRTYYYYYANHSNSTTSPDFQFVKRYSYTFSSDPYANNTTYVKTYAKPLAGMGKGNYIRMSGQRGDGSLQFTHYSN
jgi:hypothetical protein